MTYRRIENRNFLLKEEEIEKKINASINQFLKTVNLAFSISLIEENKPSTNTLKQSDNRLSEFIPKTKFTTSELDFFNKHQTSEKVRAKQLEIQNKALKQKHEQEFRERNIEHLASKIKSPVNYRIKISNGSKEISYIFESIVIYEKPTELDIIKRLAEYIIVDVKDENDYVDYKDINTRNSYYATYDYIDENGKQLTEIDDIYEYCNIPTAEEELILYKSFKTKLEVTTMLKQILSYDQISYLHNLGLEKHDYFESSLF